ncbi:ParA family protein [Gordonia sihwensis]|uniref:ParA family protein n=1 Tax=Gordonia sihwensis TaxID=173559 RepID=UPI0005EDF349|nr:ParA family protein [Gordonia sihwensis]KJR10302.1 hypothetical protein UG54_01625 [Gordonia sihwensis]
MTAHNRTIAVANGKGGVGKTSVAINLAALVASTGSPVLLIDLDPQGNAGEDLGYNEEGTNKTDNGKGLFEALANGAPLAPIQEVRPNLDVLAGGDALDDLEGQLVLQSLRRGTHSLSLLADALTPIADQYSLIVIDTPPTRPTLLQLALSASGSVVIPTKSDRASIKGLGKLAKQMADVRANGNNLTILGAVLYGVGSTSTSIKREAAADIAAVMGDIAPVFETTIRHSERTAKDVRDYGLLPHELAAEAEAAEPWWKALKEGRAPEASVGRSAGSLASDFIQLTREVQIALVNASERV